MFQQDKKIPHPGMPEIASDGRLFSWKWAIPSNSLSTYSTLWPSPFDYPHTHTHTPWGLEGWGATRCLLVSKKASHKHKNFTDSSSILHFIVNVSGSTIFSYGWEQRGVLWGIFYLCLAFQVWILVICEGLIVSYMAAASHCQGVDLWSLWKWKFRPLLLGLV